MKAHVAASLPKMSFAPFVSGNNSHLPGQHFGQAVATEELRSALNNHQTQSRQRLYNRPWNLPSDTTRQDVGSTVQALDDRFEINLDVQQFKPEEIAVHATNQHITVEAKHEEKEDEHGHISRQFVRRYVLPTGYDSDRIVSTLSSNGVLTITAQKMALPEQEVFRVIPVAHPGQPRDRLTDTTWMRNGNGVDN